MKIKNKEIHESLDNMLDWTEKPVGKTYRQPVIINGLLCNLDLTIVDSWDNIQARELANSIKWIMNH